MNTPLHWNAVYTRPNYEKKVSSQLEKKGITYYCPLNQVTIKGSNQKKYLLTPLFPSIIFVQLPEGKSIGSLADMSNVINVLYYHRQPATFPDAEISTIRNFLEAHESVAVIKRSLGIANGLQGPETSLSRYSMPDKEYMLDLPSLGYSLSAKAKPVTSIKLVGKNAGLYRTTEKLAFILGLRSSNSRKFQ